MHPALAQFGLAAGMLALGATLARLLRLPALPAYLLIGLIASTWLDVEVLQPLPDLGLVLLLFTVGLEFGPDRLMRLSRQTLRAGLWDAASMPLGPVLTRGIKGRRLTLARRSVRQGRSARDLHGS